MTKCFGCGKEKPRNELIYVCNNLYCEECSTEAIDKLFKKIKITNAKRKQKFKREERGELPSPEA